MQWAASAPVGFGRLVQPLFAGCGVATITLAVLA
jgi:hypothetical protein